MKIDNELIERYKLYRALKYEMDKIYRYKWGACKWNKEKGWSLETEWIEATDKLSDILYKKIECLIENPEIIEQI